MRNVKMVKEALGRVKRIGLEDFPRAGRESVLHLFTGECSGTGWGGETASIGIENGSGGLVRKA